MSFSLLVHRVRKLFRARKSWRKPRRAHVLFFGPAATHVVQNNIVLDLIGPEAVEVFDPEVVYVPLAIQSFFSRNRYLRLFMAAVQPRVCLTCMDNDVSFWDLKRHFPQVTTIIIQTGWRSALADCFSALDRNPPAVRYRVDYILAYNSDIGRKFLEYVDGRVIAIGSYKNNHVPKSHVSAPRALTFVSQFRPKQDIHPVLFYDSGTPYLWETFYAPEKALLPLLADYCRRRSIQLRVCGTGTSAEEYEFFAERIGNANWDFIARYRRDGSYHVVDRAMVVVTHESTLAYEAYGRGIRTAFFANRGEALGTDSLRFGWPGKYAASGPFWTSHIDIREVDRILDALFDASDVQWDRMRQDFAPDLMEYDPGNSRMIQLFKQVSIPLAMESSATVVDPAANSVQPYATRVTSSS